MQFLVPAGRNIREYIPKLGITPELDGIAGPFTIVVFDGPHHAIPVFPAFKPRDGSDLVFNDVVCVAVPSGEENADIRSLMVPTGASPSHSI
jgi:hypothetical protein